MTLIIVESPAKAKTIERYLGDGFTVQASYGHVRDLPKSELGVDIERNFTPTYVIPPKSKKVIAELKQAIVRSENVILATDFDREGEAIAWHIVNAIGVHQNKSEKIKVKKIERITFTEITKSALVQALKHPRQLDMDLVDAQQARRVLDRLVGYKLSPFLWKKVYRGLSAGRVQSVAVRLIVEREREIEAFTPIEYWSIEATLTHKKEEFVATLVSWNEKPIETLTITSKNDAQAIEKSLKNAAWSVHNVERGSQIRNPFAPFTTSTLQQESSRRLYYSPRRTMRVAQSLYEAGHITYMRTDSFAIATEAIQSIRAYIGKTYGAEFVHPSERRFTTKTRGAQEAHEAIRPTDVTQNPGALSLPDDQAKLYELVWRRAVATQMGVARLGTLRIDVTAAASSHTGIFRATGTVVEFEGFWKVWPRDAKEVILPIVTVGETLTLEKLGGTQHFTESPPRYTEASLIKQLEERGIGRPSTYAPTLATIAERGYVHSVKRALTPTKTAMVVNDLLVEHFPQIVDVGFTAEMEAKLDAIAEGKKEWQAVIEAFYQPFAKHLEHVLQTVKKTEPEKTERVCPRCGKPLVIRLGRFGQFYACTGFPKCKFTEAIQEKLGITCPECGRGDVVVRRTKKQRVFYGCSRYPDCKWASWTRPRAVTSDK